MREEYCVYISAHVIGHALTSQLNWQYLLWARVAHNERVVHTVYTCTYLYRSCLNESAKLTLFYAEVTCHKVTARVNNKEGKRVLTRYVPRVICFWWVTWLAAVRKWLAQRPKHLILIRTVKNRDIFHECIISLSLSLSHLPYMLTALPCVSVLGGL